MKGEQSGSTKFFSKKLKALQAKVRKKKEKKSEKDGDGNLEASGKKFSSNGSLVSQANGVSKSGNKQNAKGENVNIFVMNNPDDTSSLIKSVRSINGKELQAQPVVAERNLLDNRVEFITPSQQQNVRDIILDNEKCKSTIPPQPPQCEIVPVQPHTPNTFTEIDTRTTHITTTYISPPTTKKNKDEDYLQPPARGIDDFVSGGGEKGSCFIINTREKGKAQFCK